MLPTFKNLSRYYISFCLPQPFLNLARHNLRLIKDQEESEYQKAVKKRVGQISKCGLSINELSESLQRLKKAQPLTNPGSKYHR